MKFSGLADIGRAAVGTLIRWCAFRLVSSAQWLRLQAHRVDPTGTPGPPGSPPREWHPRLWDRSGGRTPNETRP